MKKTNVPGSQSFGQKLLQFIRNNTVPIMFILICAYCIPQAGFSWSYLLNEVMTRLGRNAFLILSLLIPVMAGMGMNFGMTLGAMAGELGLIFAADWQVWGIPGMILAAQYARERNVPFLGICLGMQIAVIEFCRNVCGIKDANSGEFDEYGLHKVIDFMPDQNKNINKGGTLRLGSYPCQIKPGTRMMECYGRDLIHERHRHRYEFNNDYRETVEAAGMVISGTSPDGRIVETVELPQNDFFVAGQFHPEFKSRPNRAHPLFKGLVKAALAYRQSRGRQ